MSTLKLCRGPAVVSCLREVNAEITGAVLYNFVYVSNTNLLQVQGLMLI